MGDRCAAFDISVKNPKCAGPFLEAQLHWARDRFSNFQFSIGDTLLAHNYVALGHPIHGRVTFRHAQEIARAEGHEWISKNDTTIDRVIGDAHPVLFRWDDWMGNPEVLDRYRQLRELFTRSSQLRAAISNFSGSFLARRGVSRDKLTPSSADHMDAYLLEELAVYQWQAEEYGAFNIYPGSDLATFEPLIQVPGLPVSLVNRDFVVLALD